MNSIFVQIASYRDPELLLTLKDCLEKAKNTELLTFGICWQKDKKENLDEYKNNPRFRIIEIDYKDSKGACWARHQANTLYENEAFILQIDSHMRFIENWDEEMLNMWKELSDSKAVLTTYPCEYYPDKPRDQWKTQPHIIHTYAFKNSETQQRPKTPKDWRTRTEPYRARHVAGGFIFGSSSIIKDVPYDPEFYFSGEETALAVRLYTHGYNLYHPHKLLLWHYYGRKEQPKHWTDNKEWGKLSSTAKQKLSCLLGRNTNFDLGKYGLGNVRTLEDFQNYSGIDYKRNILHLDTVEAKEPPVDLSSPERWSYTIERFKKLLKWDYTKLDKCEDPRFWAFIFKDQGDQELYRLDIKYTEEKDLIDGKITEKEFTFDYYSPAQVPTYFIIWPYSQSKKWLKSIKGLIKDYV